MLLSIRPRYAEAILRGTKTVELRRTRINVPAGAILVIYSSSPTRAVLGTAVLDGIVEDAPGALWPEVRSVAGILRREYNEYFRGARTAFALHLRDVVQLSVPVPLHDLRTRTGLEPPQSFRYVTAEQVRVLQRSTPSEVATQQLRPRIAAAARLDTRTRSRARVP
ncbi:ASCH domain-containing protein [Promicromonospora sp. NPDC023987]|uniref:ASCH domain-containing protein n=1 Tax=Promicromonospora sp. NPDC023987 TaxID=3155360 RepID=UPI0033F07638